MTNKTILIRGFSLMSILVLVVACGPYMHQTLQSRRAVLGQETPAKKILMDLPEPQEKIVTAVYKFRDQTGQYKPSETGASWSTAVTQGATTILIRVLEESGWFIPIERENIGNLLNERKVIRTSRAQYEGGDQGESMLPPLLFAGVILEGGIISYESNIVTGGAGVRYFGADLSGQYREDRISIYIRAVSTANGKVLKTVYTTKSLLSQEISAGFFRYVKAKRLLEAETGFTYNEPSEICVTEAIEKAVESLIIEGVNEKLWGLRNSADTSSVAITNYWKEKQMVYDSDPFGKYLTKNNRGRINLGMSFGSNYYSGDYSNSSVRPDALFSVGYAFSNNLFLNAEGGYRGLRVQDIVNDDAYSAVLGLRYVIFAHEKFSPFFGIGAGTDYHKPSVGLSNNEFLPKLNGNIGAEYMIMPKFGFSLSTGIDYYLKDSFDGAESGRYSDLNWKASIGFKYYFFDL